MAKITILDHPLIKDKLTTIRSKDTASKEFYENVKTISSLMTFEVFRDLPLKDVEIETPICKSVQKVISKKIIIIPILRAGLGMLDGFREMVPNARVGFIGLCRDEITLKPKVYYQHIPNDLSDYIVVLVDPMFATGNSSMKAIELLKAKGAKNIKFACLVASPNGLEAIKDEDISLYAASLDESLNEKGYIVPGLGDCGDRLFGD